MDFCVREGEIDIQAKSNSKPTVTGAGKLSLGKGCELRIQRKTLKAKLNIRAASTVEWTFPELSII